MKTLRHALFAGSLGLLSFAGCSHNSARTPDTTPSPGLQTPSPAAATPAPAQTTGTTTEPISAPANDPTIRNTPTNSDLGSPQSPINQPAPVGGPARTPTTPSGTTDDSAATPDQNATTGTMDDSDLTGSPGAEPLSGARDAGTPPSKPTRDGGTTSDAGTKPKK
jgi:hypothetical protein